MTTITATLVAILIMLISPPGTRLGLNFVWKVDHFYKDTNIKTNIAKRYVISQTQHDYIVNIKKYQVKPVSCM